MIFGYAEREELVLTGMAHRKLLKTDGKGEIEVSVPAL
jgi:hypothetical protein